jgi:hypothetical protein
LAVLPSAPATCAKGIVEVGAGLCAQSFTAQLQAAHHKEDLDEIEDWTDRAARRMYEGAGLGPRDVDIFNPYDGYAPMAQFFLEAFQWHGVKRGDAFAFYAGDIRVEGPHPFSSSGGNLGNGRTRTAMYTDSIEQLRGTAGARQVKVRAETALAAFTTPSSGGWIMFGKSPG